MKWVLFLLLLSSSFLFGEILETSEFTELLKYADQNSLVLIDLDRSLMDADLMLGTSDAKAVFLKKALSAGYDQEMIKRLFPIYREFLLKVIPVHLVDPNSTRVISELLQRRIVVLGFTGRGCEDVQATEAQLQTLGVHFDKSFGSFHLPQERFQLKNGIVYCANLNKAEALMQFLSRVNRYFCKVILIDDRMYNHEEIDALLKGGDLEYIGLRFAGSDAREAQFDPKIVDLQWGSLPKLVPDDEAKKMITR